MRGDQMQREARNSYTILAPGFAKWRGSDGRALAQAFRGLGHNLIEIDEEDYDPWRWVGTASKAFRRVLRPQWSSDYNAAVLRQSTMSAYDFTLVFKGSLLKPETVRQLREIRKPVFNFYPDVSFTDHGPNIPAALSGYDCVFTTKLYHGEREMKEFNIRELRHVRHGFDPEVHRPVSVSPEVARNYECDVSFVGCWSKEKEETLLHLLEQAPEIAVKVFGLGWNHASQEFRRRIGKNLRPGAFGDELAMVYCSSKINLGLLSSSTSDAKLRDQTTARTFQIPAAGAFMLHEDTPEVRTFFEDGVEVLLFMGKEDLAGKVNLVLENPALRESIRAKGHQRCVQAPYDYTSAAETVLRYFGLNNEESF